MKVRFKYTLLTILKYRNYNFTKALKERKEGLKQFRRLTKHTHCGSESNMKFSLPCTERRLSSTSKCSAFAGLEVAQSQHLHWKKLYWLGDMPKRHVGYALTLSAIAGLIIARIRSDLLDFELVHLEWKVKKISIMCISNIAQVFEKK